jgi:hypothetical protein
MSQGERRQLTREVDVVVGKDRKVPDACGRYEALRDG